MTNENTNASWDGLSSKAMQVSSGNSPHAQTDRAGIYDQATQPHVPAAMGVVDADPNARPVIRVRNLKKTYLMGQTPVYALREVSLDVYPGEFVAIMGPSGSGKSTSMNMLGRRDSEGNAFASCSSGS